MLIEYITKTGYFGALWCILTLIFPFITYRFIKRNMENPHKITPIITTLIILGMMHVIAKELIGKSNFDTALIFIKDAWFLMYHVFLITVYTIIDRNIMDETFKGIYKFILQKSAHSLEDGKIR